ncbi:hypothetical protein D3C77_730690 [compost metagenome]
MKGSLLFLQRNVSKGHAYSPSSLTKSALISYICKRPIDGFVYILLYSSRLLERLLDSLSHLEGTLFTAVYGCFDSIGEVFIS